MAEQATRRKQTRLRSSESIDEQFAVLLSGLGGEMSPQQMETTASQSLNEVPLPSFSHNVLKGVRNPAQEVPTGGKAGGDGDCADLDKKPIRDDRMSMVARRIQKKISQATSISTRVHGCRARPHVEDADLQSVSPKGGPF
jgi:hypothetical protein